jgi:hypothetical protein
VIKCSGRHLQIATAVVNLLNRDARAEPKLISTNKRSSALNKITHDNNSQVHARVPSQDYLSRANGKQIDQCLCSLFFLLIATDIPYFSLCRIIFTKRGDAYLRVSLKKFPRAATIGQNLLGGCWMENAAADAKT